MYSNTCKNMIIINKYSYKYTYNYMIMSTYTYFIILIRIHVSIPLETCKNEKYFYDHCNEFEYNHDLVVIVFNKNMIF